MRKPTRLIVLAASFASPCMWAQQAVTSSGGEMSGSGGSASYSTGQVAYATITGAGGTVTQGVQQPYEIFVLGNDDFQSVSMSATVYPNPAVSNVILRIALGNFENLRYELFDLNGRLLYSDKVIGTETRIPMDIYPEATYVLKAISGNKELKTFKIIKNKI